jgi:hypothetical protein
VVSNLVVSTLEHVWTVLARLQVPAALMGGLALSVWKHARSTRDVDILVDLSDVSLATLLTELKSANIRQKREGSLVRLGDLQLLQLLYEPPESFMDLQVDLLIVDSEYDRQALGRRVPAVLGFSAFRLFVLQCEDLILRKLLAGRLIDLADCAALLRANRSAVDFGYLSNWAERLDVLAGLQTAWGEAFPGESIPTA